MKLPCAKYLKEKSLWVRQETLKIHRLASQTRLASSLSSVEIFVALYYGGVLKFDSSNLKDPLRDRLIISKGHGSVCLYPILADLGFFDKKELVSVCKKDSFLGAIPDTLIPGYETINGSLGHGLGVGCGIALALKMKNINSTVFVVLGDGELYEGSIWEATMFAGCHKLNNLILILDDNKICMLDYCVNILDLRPIEKKFQVFAWKTSKVDGHNAAKITDAILTAKNDNGNKPKLIIADTVKGKGVAALEKDSLCHIKSLSQQGIDKAIQELK